MKGNKDKCLSDYFCNWNSKVCTDSNESCRKQCEETKKEDHFCGLCENGQDCQEFSEFDNQEACEKQEVCVLPDGTIDDKLSKKECEEKFQCSDVCIRNGKERKCSKKECLNNGVCEGAEAFLQPKCVLPSHPYFNRSCDLSLSQIGAAFDSELGCVSLEILSKPQCQDFKEGKWVSYQDSTEKGCEEVGGFGCLEVVSFPDYQGDSMFTKKTKEECSKSNGDWKPRFIFKSSRWLSGKMRPLKWKKREYSTRRKWVNTLDFPRLQRVIDEGIQVTISNRRRTEARCRFEGRIASLNTIVCNCFDGEVDSKEILSSALNDTKDDDDESQEICQISSSISGFGRVCPTLPSNIFVPPVNVLFGEEAVEGTKCVGITVTVNSVLEFQSYQVENFASSFVEAPYVSNSFAFTNSEGVTIGQVIADAFIIKLSSDSPMNERNITSCVELRDDIEIDDKFTLLDFGIVKGNRIIPLQRPVETRKKLGACLLETPTEVQLIPVLLLDDWESASRFSDSSTVLIATLVGLFWLVSLFGSGQLFLGFVVQNNRFLIVHWLIVVFMAFCLLRGLYFLLLLENVIESRFVDYFLTELPTFIYFSAFTVIIFSWADVTSKTKDMRTTRGSYFGILAMVVGNLIMYGIFTMFMILFALYTTETVEASCDGRVPPEEGELFNSDQYAIAVAYHVWITAVAVILVIFIIIVGLRLLRLLTHSAGVIGKSTLR